MTTILIRDLLMNMLLGLVALVVLVLANINPASQQDQAAQPGNLVASIVWPAGAIDVDMWLSSPNDVAIGYSNKSGRVWSLLRDDLGTSNDATPMNFESAYSRGVPDGEYAVNVRCFGCAGRVPIDVVAEVRLAEGGLVWRGTVTLVADKQERTAIRFKMKGGAVMRGTESFVFKKMRGDA